MPPSPPAEDKAKKAKPKAKASGLMPLVQVGKDEIFILWMLMCRQFSSRGL
jgi:hypothetical protein